MQNPVLVTSLNLAKRPKLLRIPAGYPGEPVARKFFILGDFSSINRVMMITEISAAFGTVKTSVDLLKTLFKVTRDEDVRNAVFEIQNELLSLQDRLFAANARFEEQVAKVECLQKQLDERDKWDEVASKYALFHPAQGMSVYRNRSDMQIWACPNCFESRQISILNRPSVETENYVCHACKFEIMP